LRIEWAHPAIPQGNPLIGKYVVIPAQAGIHREAYARPLSGFPPAREWRL